jgi:proteasome lid subunit RPN8/RPN11
MPVHRSTLLPRGDLKGRFLISQDLFAVTGLALRTFAFAGIEDGGHEGIAFWAGREIGDTTLLLTAVIPNAEHSAQRVMVNREGVGIAARAARDAGLGILCQVHSHPGDDARHSEGDDQLILLPFEGMLSIVVPHFGRTFRSLADACVHQFQARRWVLCSPESVRERTVLIPISVDLT